MASARLVPPNFNQAVVDQGGIASRPWYVYLSAVGEAVNRLANTTPVDPTPPPEITYGIIRGIGSISTIGALPNVVTVSLFGDNDNPGPTCYYGTNGLGSKGWYSISDTIETTTLAKVVNPDGTISLDLPVLPDAGGGVLLRMSRDTYGRVSGTSSATTDDLAEGTSNLYFTNSRVAAALAAGPGINLSTDGAGVTTISDASLTLADLTDQTGDNLTSQSLVQLTANSAVGSIQPLLAFTLATLPSAATYKYGLIFVTDLTGGGAPCYSDGTNWRRFSDNTIAS
jgi:hypothetical protein